MRDVEIECSMAQMRRVRVLWSPMALSFADLLAGAAVASAGHAHSSAGLSFSLEAYKVKNRRENF